MLRKDSLSEVRLSSLQALPYISSTLPEGYAVASSTFYAGQQWATWLIAGDTFVPIAASPVDAIYFGDEPARPCDQFVALLNLVAQRSLRAGLIHRCFCGLIEDYQGLAASMSKVAFFHRHRKDTPSELARFVQSEVEHMLTRVRSMYDLVNELLAAHLSQDLLDTRIPRPPSTLPKSFADVALKNTAVIPSQQIAAKYNIPPALAECYYRHAAALQSLKRARDEVIHRGRSVEYVFSCDRGFAVQPTAVPQDGFYSWPSGCATDAGLVPLRPLLAQIVVFVSQMMDDFAEALASCLKRTDDAVPGFRLYSRGPHYAAFTGLRCVVETGAWDEPLGG